MHQVTTRLGELDCEILQAKEGITPPRAVVLCHGFGAPGDDLVPLGSELLSRSPALAERYRFVFPAAPLVLGGYGYADARAWWPLDLERLTRLQRSGPEAQEALREEVPEGLAKARRTLNAALDELRQRSKLSAGDVVLGGFSQGAMLTTDLALGWEEPPAGLVVLSGSLICRSSWKAKAARRAGLPVFQAHGRFDPLLLFSAAQQLSELFASSGLSAEFHPFDGPHTVALETLALLGEFLERI